MTTTQTRVLPDLDEALDFSPTCDGITTSCDRSAKWIGETLCGCTRRLLCDPHHDQIVRDLSSTTYTSQCFTCGIVAADADIVTWRPL